MLKFAKLTMATMAATLLVAPAFAQDEPEEPRTSYTVTMLKLADGADNRWAEIRSEYIVPATAAAGQSQDTVHWVMMNPDYDLIIVSELEGGMGSMDTHANPHRAAFVAALTEIVGGEEALAALRAEADTLVESRVTYYTHTHP